MLRLPVAVAAQAACIRGLCLRQVESPMDHLRLLAQVVLHHAPDFLLGLMVALGGSFAMVVLAQLIFGYIRAGRVVAATTNIRHGSGMAVT